MLVRHRTSTELFSNESTKLTQLLQLPCQRNHRPSWELFIAAIVPPVSYKRPKSSPKSFCCSGLSRNQSRRTSSLPCLSVNQLRLVIITLDLNLDIHHHTRTPDDDGRSARIAK